MAVEWVGEDRSEGVDAFAFEMEHASRRLLERTLRDPADEAAWTDLVALYERQAADWQAWVDGNPHYLDALRAALVRIDPVSDVLEVCCGTGNATVMIAERAARVLAVDASAAMIARVPSIANVTWRQSDVRHLPAEDGAFDLVVGVNAVPWPREVVRVCRPGGRVLWVGSFGADTPLYIEPERLAAMLGPGWSGQAGTVGRGTWCLLTRS
ncbi:MAG: class I SAM-dependent methyltransferase [Candidatus Limnocylindrales bacterium]